MYMHTGERVDVIVHANQPVGSYYIVVRGLGECAEKRVQQLAILRYVGGPPTPSRPLPLYDNAPTGIVSVHFNYINFYRFLNHTTVCFLSNLFLQNTIPISLANIFSSNKGRPLHLGHGF